MVQNPLLSWLVSDQVGIAAALFKEGFLLIVDDDEDDDESGDSDGGGIRGNASSNLQGTAVGTGSAPREGQEDDEEEEKGL